LSEKMAKIPISPRNGPTRTNLAHQRSSAEFQSSPVLLRLAVLPHAPCPPRPADDVQELGFQPDALVTVIPFCRFAMQHEGFRAGDFTTHFVNEEYDPSVFQVEDLERDELAVLAATLYYRHTQEDDAPAITTLSDGQDGLSPWRRRRRHAS